jgi:hypothetical protein
VDFNSSPINFIGQVQQIRFSHSFKKENITTKGAKGRLREHKRLNIFVGCPNILSYLQKE